MTEIRTLGSVDFGLPLFSTLHSKELAYPPSNVFDTQTGYISLIYHINSVENIFTEFSGCYSSVIIDIEYPLFCFLCIDLL